jgi:hypothetical protein
MPDDVNGSARSAADVPSDEELGALVRAVVDRWQPPPQRLDRPSWRDRTAERLRPVAGTPRAGRALRGGGGRSLAGLGLAATLTVVLALVVASIGSTVDPRIDPETDDAAPLPKLQLEGDPPFSRVVVSVLEGGYQSVDLATGDLVPSDLSGWTSGPRRLVRLPEGDFACACVELRESRDGRSVTGVLEVRRYDEELTEVGRSVVRRYHGEAEPGDGDTRPVRLALRPGPPGLLFVGWALAGPAGPSAGVHVLDMTAGRIVATADLDGDAAPAGGSSLFEAPIVEVDPGGRRAVISVARDASDADSSRTRWLADLDPSTRALTTTPLADVDGPAGRCDPVTAGFAADGAFVELCGAERDETRVRRRAPDGSILGEAAVPAWLGSAGNVRALDPGGRHAWIWNPDGDELARLDLITGESQARRLSGAGTSLDLGRWIAPVARAKAVVGPEGESPLALVDGRLYVPESGPASQPHAGTRLRVVDAATLDVVSTLTLPAPIVTLAPAGDRWLVVAGAPGPERVQCGANPVLPCASGQVPDLRPVREASVAVVDLTSGRTIALAGRLGASPLLVSPGLVPR